MRYIAFLSLVGMVWAQEIPTKGVEVVEFSHGWKPVVVSQGDVNRIVCTVGDVKSVVYSQEKELQVKVDGRNVYVKFVPKEEGGKMKVADFAREIYIECGGEVFQLLLYPKSIPATTTYLKLPYRPDKSKAQQLEKASEYEKVIAELIKSVYMEEVPEGYELKLVNQTVRRFAELDLILYRQYVGDKYVVEEYIINSKMDLTLHEGAFLPYLKAPLAISIVKPLLKEGESTRMIVVARNLDEHR